MARRLSSCVQTSLEAYLKATGEVAWVLGRMVKGEGKVIYM